MSSATATAGSPLSSPRDEARIHIQTDIIIDPVDKGPDPSLIGVRTEIIADPVEGLTSNDDGNGILQEDTNLSSSFRSVNERRESTLLSREEPNDA